MRISIGQLYELRIIAEHERQEAIKQGKGNRGNKVQNYGQLLVISNICDEVLRNCQAEIELSSQQEVLLVPFIMQQLLEDVTQALLVTK